MRYSINRQIEGLELDDFDLFETDMQIHSGDIFMDHLIIGRKIVLTRLCPGHMECDRWVDDDPIDCYVIHLLTQEEVR